MHCHCESEGPRRHEDREPPEELRQGQHLRDDAAAAGAVHQEEGVHAGRGDHGLGEFNAYWRVPNKFEGSNAAGGSLSISNVRSTRYLNRHRANGSAMRCEQGGGVAHVSGT